MTLKSLFAAALTAFALGGSASVVLACDDPGKSPSDHDHDQSRLLVAIKKVRPAIVVIQGTKKQDGLDEAKSPALAGVGIVVDRKGVIVTGLHVIDGLEDIEIVLPDGRKLAAHAVASNRRPNVAIVTVEAAARLTCARFSDSNKVGVGDLVLTFGSPFGNEISVVWGLVSATNRVTKSGERVLQIDYAIGPGGPYGPVVNLDGRIIGLAVPVPNREIGLAIPGNRVKEIYTELAEGK